jgi:hypothetical protein
MRSILEALARWRPPPGMGSITSVAVEGGEAALSFAVMVDLERPGGSRVAMSCTIRTSDADRMDVRALTNVLSEAAFAAWAARPEPVAREQPVVAPASKASRHSTIPTAAATT